MGTFGTWLLALTTFFSIFAILYNPLYDIEDRMGGATQSELNEAIKAWMENAGIADFLGAGIKWGCLFTFALVLQWILEPYFELQAIRHGIGNVYFAYGAFAVTIFSWVWFVRELLVSRKKTKEVFTIGNSQGVVFHEVVESNSDDVRVAIKKPTVRTWATRAFFSLPEIYFCYLLFTLLSSR